MSEIYLDYNGSAPLDPAVLEAMLPLLRDGVGNASSSHLPGQRQAACVERARSQVAALTGTSGGAVIFTSGATEANNLALQGVALDGRPKRRRVLVSAGEHASVTGVARWLDDKNACAMEVLPLTPGGHLDLDALRQAMDSDVLLVSAVAANSETGVLNDLAAIAEIVHEYGAVFHTDATQFVGRLPFSCEQFDVDLASLSGHKLCGPAGVGALVGKRQVLKSLMPTVHGGGHEKGLRAGSLNVAGIVGLGAACEIGAAVMSDEAKRVGVLRDQLVRDLQTRIGGITQNGDIKSRLPNTANVRLEGAEAEAIVATAHRVAISAGSACNSRAMEPSPVLLAMGLNRQAADESIRLSLGRFSTAHEVTQAAELIAESATRVRDLTEVLS